MLLVSNFPMTHPLTATVSVHTIGSSVKGLQLQARLHLLCNSQLCYCNQSTGKLLVGDATARTTSDTSATSRVLYLTENNRAIDSLLTQVQA